MDACYICCYIPNVNPCRFDRLFILMQVSIYISGTVAVASKRKFRNAWLEQGLFKAWLEPVEDDPHKARCKVCKSFLAAEINSLKRHARCKLHKLHEAVERTTPELNEEDNDRITIAEIKLTGFFVEHRIPFTTADHLIGLLKHLFPECSNLQKCYLKQTRVKKRQEKVVVFGETELNKKSRDFMFSINQTRLMTRVLPEVHTVLSVQQYRNAGKTALKCL